MRARHLFLPLLLSILGLAPLVQAQTPENAEREARRAGLQWLQLIDRAQYDKAWDQGTHYLQEAVKKDAFSAAMRDLRQPAGKLKRRSLSEATYTSRVAGAPEGHYVVLSFSTQFAERDASEVLTMCLVGDTWKPTGYFMR